MKTIDAVCQSMEIIYKRKTEINTNLLNIDNMLYNAVAPLIREREILEKLNKQLHDAVRELTGEVVFVRIDE